MPSAHCPFLAQLGAALAGSCLAFMPVVTTCAAFVSAAPHAVSSIECSLAYLLASKKSGEREPSVSKRYSCVTAWEVQCVVSCM